MIVGVPKETAPGERRVALVPEGASKLVKMGIEVCMEQGAGNSAYFSDSSFEAAGVRLVSDAPTLFRQSEVVLKVQGPGMNEALGVHEVEMLAEGSVLIGMLQPLLNPDTIQRLAARSIFSFSLDALPRIARAQAMDALTAMSSIAGYQAVLLAAHALPKFFPLMMTAAGTTPPAKGLILGAGVAGLQAIATARRLGAVMRAFDVRLAAKEQVESLGATFVAVEEASHEDAGGYATELSDEKHQRELELIHHHIRETDFVISTALIPGRPAPRLITAEMVHDMQSGSVIVDLAAEMGGNCELTEPGNEIAVQGVRVFGPFNLSSQMPIQASQMYSRNISSLLLHMVTDGRFRANFDDTIVQGCCITRDNQVVHPAAKALTQ